MSKVVKQMQMDALKNTFGSVKDYVVLSIKGLSAISENQFRHALRKKNVRLMQVKNSLARLTFQGLGITIEKDSPYWTGSTTFAWGGASVADLSRSIESELKNPKTQAVYKEKVTVKGAIAEGQLVPFDVALTMPTREEAIASVIAMILGPGSQIASQLTGPASQVASQIEKLSEKQPEAEAAGTPAA